MPRPLALITGASSGIGAAFAPLIAEAGYDLVLVARRADRLRALADRLPADAMCVTADLSEPGAAEALITGLPRPLSVLVNNAGVGCAGPFTERALERQTGMVDLNIRALVELSHRALPAMLEAGAGGIINVASTAAYQPGPRMAVYYASKAFVLSFSEALWEEVRGRGVTVTAVCPGPTTSEFGAVAGMEELRVFRYATKLSAEQVAQEGWQAFRAGKRVVVNGLQNKATRWGGRLVPHRLLLPIVKRLQTPG